MSCTVSLPSGILYKYIYKYIHSNDTYKYNIQFVYAKIGEDAIKHTTNV